MRVQVHREFNTADNDPLVGISDGTDFVGVAASDSGNSSVFNCSQGTDGAVPVAASFGSGSGGSSANFRWYELLLRVSPTSIRCLARSDPGLSPAWGLLPIASRPLNVDAALKLVWVCDDAGEAYGLYGIEVTVTEEGP